MQPETLKRAVIAADDSIIIRDNIRAALGESWRIFLAVDGAEAVDYARKIVAALVLLDLRMPRVDGVDACAAIRSLPGYSTVPIVLLTAYDSVDVQRRADSAGATAVFPKPFTRASLQARAQALVATGQADEAATPNYELAEPSEPLDALATGRAVLAVHRQFEAAAKQRRYASFADIMAAWRAQSRR